MKNEFSIKKILIIILAISILWGMVMYAIDCSVPCLRRIPHHISGEVWFQLISSWLLALPSIGICAYALIQTKKYHDLDEEHLYPKLLMESAEISMCMVNWTGFDQWVRGKEDICMRQQEEYEQYRKKHGGKQSISETLIQNDESDNLGYLEFKSTLILKGGESVSRITIQQIAINIGNNQYHMKIANGAETGQSEYEVGARISFNRRYKNGQEEYHIIWKPDYECIVCEENEKRSRELSQEFTRQKQDVVYAHMEKIFWDDMYNAVFDSEYDIVKRDMEWQILMSIEYGINIMRRKRMSKSASWRIRWNGKMREHVNEYTKIQRSEEGIVFIG